MLLYPLSTAIELVILDAINLTKRVPSPVSEIYLFFRQQELIIQFDTVLKRSLKTLHL